MVCLHRRARRWRTDADRPDAVIANDFYTKEPSEAQRPAGSLALVLPRTPPSSERDPKTATPPFPQLPHPRDGADQPAFPRDPQKRPSSTPVPPIPLQPLFLPAHIQVSGPRASSPHPFTRLPQPSSILPPNLAALPLTAVLGRDPCSTPDVCTTRSRRGRPGAVGPTDRLLHDCRGLGGSHPKCGVQIPI